MLIIDCGRKGWNLQDNCGLGYKENSEGGEKWTFSGFIFKLDTAGLLMD